MSGNLEALIDATISRALERFEGTVQEKFDALTASNEALAGKNRQLLREKKLAEGKPSDTRSPAEKAADRLLGKDEIGVAADEVRITRTEARDTAIYREKRADAQRRGVPLRIIDDTENRTSERVGSSISMFDDPLRGVTYANSKLVREIGIVRLKQIARAKGHALQYFSAREDLPDHAWSLHDAAAR
jgi:hypothetical protein